MAAGRFARMWFDMQDRVPSTRAGVASDARASLRMTVLKALLYAKAVLSCQFSLQGAENCRSLAALGMTGSTLGDRVYLGDGLYVGGQGSVRDGQTGNGRGQECPRHTSVPARHVFAGPHFSAYVRDK